MVNLTSSVIFANIISYGEMGNVSALANIANDYGDHTVVMLANPLKL